MLYIRKGPEPTSLIEYRSHPGATYSEFRNNEDIREALLHDQGHLCAYCMRHITIDTMKVEHWIAQNMENDEGEGLTLSYSNMLGVCDGYEGSPPNQQTCDTHKKNDKISINPLEQHCVDLIEYGRDGTISSPDERYNDDLNNTLNLNCTRSYLKINRKAVYEALNDHLQKKNPTGTWDRGLLQRTKAQFESISGDGTKEEYSGVALYWIAKYMRRAK